MELLAQYHLTGIFIGVATFLIIGLFHPLVIKGEYHFGVRCWWVFCVMGIAAAAGSVAVEQVVWSTLLAVWSASSFWSIGELFQQRKRVAKGWFPANPKRRHPQPHPASGRSSASWRPPLLRAAAALAAGALLALPVRLQRADRQAPPEPERQPVEVRLLFAGDVMQHTPQIQAARQADGTFDYAPVFAALRERFAAADVVVVNLETTLTRSSRYTGYPCFRSPAALAGALREAGVDVALLANNHCCDGGGTGIRSTVELLDSCGLLHTGVFADSLDRAQHHPLLLRPRGIPVALLNYTYGTNGLPVPAGRIVNPIDTAAIIADIARARSRGARCVAVCLHWGSEYERHPNAAQRTIARTLRRAGADLVIGSHPHVIQPFEADSTHVCCYSLGNFVSNQRKRYCDGGLLAEVTLTLHPDDRITYACTVTPVWVALPGYRILPPEAADTLDLPAGYARFRSDTEALLGTAPTL